MKLRYRQRIIYDNLVSHVGRNLSICVLMVLCFVLIGMSVLYYENLRYCEKSADAVLKYGIHQTETIRFGTIHQEIYPFLEEVSGTGIIYGIGAWDYGGTDAPWIKELLEIQGDHRVKLSYEENKDCLEMYYVNRKVLPLFHLKLKEGMSWEKLKRKKNLSWLYLGSAYQDIKVGTEYRWELQDGTVLVYKVAGILQKDQEVPIPCMDEISRDTVTASCNMDYGIIFVEDTYGLTTNSGCFSFAEGKQKEAEELIKKTAQKYQIEYEMEPLEDIFARVKEENKEFIYLISRIAVIIMAISLVLINSQHIANFMERRREYGILYAQGFGRSDLLYVIVGETVVLFLAVLLLSVLMMQWICSGFWGDINDAAFTVAKRIILTNVYPAFLLLAVVNSVVSTGIIYHIIKTKTPVELMEKEN